MESRSNANSNLRVENLPPGGAGANGEGNDDGSETNSNTSALLSDQELIMSNSARDFEIVLDAPDIELFVQEANRLTNPKMRQIWIEHRLNEARTYLAEWKKASRTYLDLTPPQQLLEQARRGEAKYQKMPTLADLNTFFNPIIELLERRY